MSTVMKLSPSYHNMISRPLLLCIWIFTVQKKTSKPLLSVHRGMLERGGLGCLLIRDPLLLCPSRQIVSIPLRNIR